MATAVTPQTTDIIGAAVPRNDGPLKTKESARYEYFKNGNPVRDTKEVAQA
jgi:hypothetical protein